MNDNVLIEDVLLKKSVKKGEIRNTVLRQIKEILESIKLLEEGKEIKAEELEYHKNNKAKIKKLKKQINIIENGISHLNEAIEILNRYKSVTTSWGGQI